MERADVLGAEVRVPAATASLGPKDGVYVAGRDKVPDSGGIDHNDPGLPPRIARRRQIL